MDMSAEVKMERDSRREGKRMPGRQDGGVGRDKGGQRFKMRMIRHASHRRVNFWRCILHRASTSQGAGARCC